MKRALAVLLVSCLPLLSLSAQAPVPQALPERVSYDKDVKPLLAQNCYSCHGAEVQQAGLRLDLRQNALRGGDYGPVIVPGKSAESKLIRRLVDGDGGDADAAGRRAVCPKRSASCAPGSIKGAEFRNEVADEAPPKPIDPKLAALIAAVAFGAAFDGRRNCIAASPDLLKARDPAGSTLLHHAAGFGTLETMTWLLDAGADVNAKNRRGSTPLHWAIHDEAKVRLLLARGAAVNAKQVEGRTPLYLAASLGNGHGILRLLLDHGADPNLANCQRADAADGRGRPRRCRGDAAPARREGRRRRQGQRRRDRADAGGGRRQPAGRPAAARPRRRRSCPDETQRDRARQRRHGGQRGGRAAAARSRRGGECAQHPRLLAADARRQLRHHSLRRGETAAGAGRGHQLQGRLRRNRPRPRGQARRHRSHAAARRRTAEAGRSRDVAHRPDRESGRRPSRTRWSRRWR